MKNLNQWLMTASVAVVIGLGAANVSAHHQGGRRNRHGRFREDLFYRLNVIELNIPPLASHFIHEFTQGRARFSAQVSDCLERYALPGSVRELRNAMERASLLSQGELVLPEYLPTRVRASGQGPSPVEPADAERLEAIECQAIFRP